MGEFRALSLHPTGARGGTAKDEAKAAPRKIPVMMLDPVK
jgi:hypothetical protein